MNTIHHIAKHNRYPITMIQRLNNQIINKKNSNTNNTQTQHNNQKWITFEYHIPIIRKITNIFRNTNLNITYRISNTTQNLLKTYIRNNDIYTNSRIYSIKCNTCNKRYIDQTSRSLKTRFTEHFRYIKTNNPRSAYALHILNIDMNMFPYKTEWSSLKYVRKDGIWIP
jgi:hypothetical protein